MKEPSRRIVNLSVNLFSLTVNHIKLTSYKLFIYHSWEIMRNKFMLMMPHQCKSVEQNNFYFYLFCNKFPSIKHHLRSQWNLSDKSLKKSIYILQITSRSVYSCDLNIKSTTCTICVLMRMRHTVVSFLIASYVT